MALITGHCSRHCAERRKNGEKMPLTERKWAMRVAPCCAIVSYVFFSSFSLSSSILCPSWFRNDWAVVQHWFHLTCEVGLSFGWMQFGSFTLFGRRNHENQLKLRTKVFQNRQRIVSIQFPKWWRPICSPCKLNEFHDLYPYYELRLTMVWQLNCHNCLSGHCNKRTVQVNGKIWHVERHIYPHLSALKRLCLFIGSNECRRTHWLRCRVQSSGRSSLIYDTIYFSTIRLTSTTLVPNDWFHHRLILGGVVWVWSTRFSYYTNNKWRSLLWWSHLLLQIVRQEHAYGSNIAI